MGPLGVWQPACPSSTQYKCRPGRSLPGRHGLLGLHHRAAMPTEATYLPPANSIPASGQALLQSEWPEWREWGAATSPQICLSTSPRGKSSCTASVTWATPTLSGVRLPQALTSMALCGGIQTHRTRSTSVSLLCDHVPIDSVTGN